MILFISAKVKYWQSTNAVQNDVQKSTSCPVNAMIETERECIVAADVKGLYYVGNLREADKLTGCYNQYGKVYFNGINNFKSVVPYYKAFGLCKEGIIVWSSKDILQNKC